MFILAIFLNGIMLGVSIASIIYLRLYRDIDKELNKLKEDQLKLAKIAKELKDNEDPYNLFSKD